MTAPTTLITAAGPEQDARPRPLPWRRMLWVTWRQHRSALTGVGALLGALAVCFFIAGLQLHHAYAAAVSCHPASSFACVDLVSSFNGMYGFLANGFLPQVVPVLIGAFVEAPVLARELETGTYRFAWTQGFGRWRWTLSKLVGLAVVVAAAAGAISILLSWYYQPYFNSGNQFLSLSEWTPLGPPCSTDAGSASPLGPWPPSPSGAWRASSSAGSSPRLPPPWPRTPGSLSRPAASCGSIT